MDTIETVARIFEFLFFAVLTIDTLRRWHDRP